MLSETKFDDILTFWFEETEPTFWFKKDSTFDTVITERFSSTLAAAKACELYTWRSCPTGRLAEIIVLDQFSRNIFRDQAEAFAADALALALACVSCRVRVKSRVRGALMSFSVSVPSAR